MPSALKWFGDKARAYVHRKIDAEFRRAGQAWKDAARGLAPEDSGYLKSTIGFAYDASKRRLKLYCDAPYAYFQEFGTRFVKPHPFMRPALSAVSRLWRGSATYQAPNVAAKYHARIRRHARGKTGPANLEVGRGDFE